MSHVTHIPTPTCEKLCHKSAYYARQVFCGSDPISQELLDLFFTFVESLRPIATTLSTPSSQLATFNIGPNIDRVFVEWQAMSDSSPMSIQTGRGYVDVIDSQFSISVPYTTTDLKVSVTVQDRVVVTAIIPQNSPMTKLTGDDLNLYMMFKYANEVAVNTSGLDHTTSGGHKQLGPHRSSRAMAIVHIAIMNALIAIYGKYSTFNSLSVTSSPTASPLVAIAQAMHDTLVFLYDTPSEITRLGGVLSGMLATIPDGQAKTEGIALGAATAAQIILLRSTDIIEAEKIVGTDYIPSGDYGRWSAANGTQALGWKWADNISTFVLPTKDHIPCPIPAISGNPTPTLEEYLTSREYAMAYNQAKAIGGDGVVTPTIRSSFETLVGLYWAYDGTPSLCAPPRLYNQLAMKIMSENMVDCYSLIRTVCLMNVAMADTAISCWYYKYHYKLWRPITAIRDSRSTNAEIVYDPDWTPYGAPSSNTNDPHFTPPFPSFPSGHATFGGTVFEILRSVVGDETEFTFVSDELNGETTDVNGIRALVPRAFTTLSQAEDENGFSRIPLGIHFIIDKTSGIQLGNGIGNYVSQHCFVPSFS